MMSDLERAAYDTVHEYPGGAPRLAQFLGVRPGTLNNKVDPGCETHHLSVDEALALMLISGDYRILEALSRSTNHLCIRLEHLASVSDLDLLTAYTQLHERLGKVAGAIREAFADGRFERAEYQDIRRLSFDSMNAQFELLRRLERLIDG